MRLPEDILRLINEFICKKVIEIDKDVLESVKIKLFKKSCNLIRYKTICACEVHDDPVFFSCIKTLKPYENKKPISIHFNSESSCKYALQFKDDFGEFSHLCCSNTGMMFKKDIKMKHFNLLDNDSHSNMHDIM